jgi:transposase
MDAIHPCCAGLDVHKDGVAACVRRADAKGKARRQTRTFATTTGQSLELADWLAGEGVTHAAMASAGAHWKPIRNILAGHFQILPVNARHVKQAPGRKTDVKDAEWVAQPLQHGLLRGSFVPVTPRRELRELTRQRRQLIQAKASVANRIRKVLEDADIRPGSVAADVPGVSGRDMPRALVAGREGPEELAEPARRRLRAKVPQSRLALHGRVTGRHRFLPRLLLEEVERHEAWIARLSARIGEVLPAPFAEAAGRPATIPGIDERAAENILAEIGVDMSRFPGAGHPASWTGMCSGNHESAGKRRSGRTTKGNRRLRGALVRVAWAASHTKATHLSAQYRRLAGRRGRKRALAAPGHTILVIIYQVLRDQTTYREPGPDYFDRLDTARLTRTPVRRLERLGHKVTLQPQEPAA